MKKDLNKMIARAIIAAQLCSDGGKYDVFLLEEIQSNTTSDFWQKCWNKEYDQKLFWIARAIQMINCSKSGFRYHLVKTGDQNGYPSILVYFEFKLDGVRHQVSFHTPMGQEVEKRIHFDLKKIPSGRKTRWDHKSSRLAALELYKYYFK